MTRGKFHHKKKSWKRLRKILKYILRYVGGWDTRRRGAYFRRHGDGIVDGVLHILDIRRRKSFEFPVGVLEGVAGEASGQRRQTRRRRQMGRNQEWSLSSVGRWGRQRRRWWPAKCIFILVRDAAERTRRSQAGELPSFKIESDKFRNILTILSI